VKGHQAAEGEGWRTLPPPFVIVDAVDRGPSSRSGSHIEARPGPSRIGWRPRVTARTTAVTITALALASQKPQDGRLALGRSLTRAGPPRFWPSCATPGGPVVS
jgi:hypothetical protein